MNQLPFVSWGWAEGRYLDLWMLVHFLTGAVGGLSNVYFQLPQLGVFALGSAMMISWEIGERALGVRESWSNRVIDVGIGLGGVWLALRVASYLEPRSEYLLLGATLATAIVLMGFGLRAFKARSGS